MSTFRYRTRQYDTTTGALIGPGPIPKTLEAGSPLNDVPSMSVTFNDPQNIILAPAELSVEVSFDDGQTWTEPPNMRFAIIGNNRDRITSPKYPSLKAVGMFWQLRKAVINAVNGPFDADGRRAWANITPGALIRTLIQEAQDRAPFGRRQRLDVIEPIDELPVALLGGYPPGAGVRLGDVALGLQHRHIVADRRRRNPEIVPLYQGFRADRFLGGDEVGDDRAQHLETTVVGASHRRSPPWPVHFTGSAASGTPARD